jgi:hypothetical protein
MSLFENVVDEQMDAQSGFAQCVSVWDWVRSMIDVPKFRNRAMYANNNPTVPVKVVLMEYSASYRSADKTTSFYIPKTRINTNCLQYDSRVVDYLHYQIADYDPTVVVYSRRKVINGLVPHKYLRQLVVKFNVVPKDPTHIPSPIEKLDSDDDDYKDMPPLISVRQTN